VSEKDGWIYYLRKADSFAGEKEETLWRFRQDRFLSDELVTDEEVWDLNVAGQTLYYSIVRRAGPVSGGSKWVQTR